MRFIKQLCTSESRYRELMEQVSDLIFVLDQQSNLIEVNTQACEVLDYTREELLQFNLRDLTFCDDQIIATFRFAEVQAGKTVITKARLRRKDGTAPISSMICWLSRLLLALKCSALQST